jgi:hypothetical protein
VTRFCVGLDLGQAQDYAALCVLEKLRKTEETTVEETVNERHPTRLWEWQQVTRQVKQQISLPSHYHCRFLERLPLGTPYPVIVQKVGEMLHTPQLRGQSTLVVDATGVGKPVVDMFTQAGLSPVAVAITGGLLANFEKGMWRVPKRILVSTIQALAHERLKFDSTTPATQVLIRELLAFQVTATEAANDTYAGRTGEHDDYVLSVALAAWYAENCAFQVIIDGQAIAPDGTPLAA